jgi:hypothetical protein
MNTNKNNVCPITPIVTRKAFYIDVALGEKARRTHKMPVLRFLEVDKYQTRHFMSLSGFFFFLKPPAIQYTSNTR